MQRRTVTDCHFFFENRRVRAGSRVKDRIVLNIRSVANAYVIHIAPNGAVAPDRRFFAEVNIANYLSTGFDVRGWVNLRVNPTKRSNHDVWRDSNIVLN